MYSVESKSEPTGGLRLESQTHTKGGVTMPIKDPAKRYEINRKVRACLTRHAVDLTQLQYSNTGETVYLFGKLIKEPQGDFKMPEVETMFKDLAAIPEVTDISVELDNWNVLYEPGFVQIRQKR